MANSSVNKNRSSHNTKSKKTSSKKTAQNQKKTVDYRKETEMLHEIGLIVFLILMIILFLSNFGIIGPVGNAVSSVLFGLFGLTAYIVPIVFFIGASFWYANSGNVHALRKLISGIFLFLMLGVISDLISNNATNMTSYDLKTIYKNCQLYRNGGGVFGGSINYLFYKCLGSVGTILVVILCSAISFILMTEKSLISGVRDGGSKVLEKGREGNERRKEFAQQRRSIQEEQRAIKEAERIRRDEERRIKNEERRLQAQEKETEKILRMDMKVSGVALDTKIPKKEDMNYRRDDIHEIMYTDSSVDKMVEKITICEEKKNVDENMEFDFDKIRIQSANLISEQEPEKPFVKKPETVSVKESTDEIRIHNEPTGDRNTEKKTPKKYIFPPLSRLQKGSGNGNDNTKELKETAMRLQQTLNTFGVKVIVTDISQGPSVTRYELQPEQGVKVSKIISLTDDIKLNLAATDIRIEAPIPGKAAIGIEVPNKETIGVALRDLFESKDFREFPSNIAFAVGKDITGHTIVTDIAKMPHMLIAGATGSGKSVCINTLIMSILYKAHPDDVKLIMVDPKVVELSVYNGIPHLLIPVVTDPKKASAALHWAVNEMNDRYGKFADMGVRDLKGYNKKVEEQRENGDETACAKLPQIVIIVDELADLMMVAPGEVEESICRLAQLARACGIHLIIATQRPSVDVITGLIKANMPSRIAFSVSSGVDSRTILDMNGAEKLLGKGDMLFYPQGYSKPARVQGAFVSDREVADVVDFLKNQTLGNTYAEDIEEKLKNISSSSASGQTGTETSGSGNGLDEYFADAGRFIIEKDKASIGMLQRMFRIGFNRAARIMDQLCEYGVVGEEEGTKPRRVLMSMEQFEQLIEEVI